MNILKLLKRSLKDKFKANCVVEECKKKIMELAEEQTIEKYRTKNITRNGMDFELIGVKTWFNIYDYEIKHVGIRLIFVVCSKLPKFKRDRVQKIKQHFEENNNLPYDNFKIPLHAELSYEVTVENVLLNKINLNVI